MCGEGIAVKVGSFKCRGCSHRFAAEVEGHHAVAAQFDIGDIAVDPLTIPGLRCRYRTPRECIVLGPVPRTAGLWIEVESVGAVRAFVVGGDNAEARMFAVVDDVLCPSSPQVIHVGDHHSLAGNETVPSRFQAGLKEEIFVGIRRLQFICVVA